MSDQTTDIGIRILADGSLARGEVKLTREDLEKLAATQDKTASTAKRNAVAEQQLAGEFQNLLKQLEPANRATLDVAHAQDVLNRGLQAGLITQKQYEAGLEIVNKTSRESAEASKQAASGASDLKNEFGDLFDNVLNSRGQQSLANAASLTRTLGLVAGLTAIGLTAVAAVLIKNSINAELYSRELGKLNREFTAAGQGAVANTAMLRQQVDQLDSLSDVSRQQAIGAVEAFARIPQVATPMMQKLLGLSHDFAAALGTDLPTASKVLAQSFAEPASGARQLDQQFNFLTADQLKLIESYERQGLTLKAQDVLYRALQVRMAGLADKGLTPVQISMNSVSASWERFNKAIENSEAVKTTVNIYGYLVDRLAYLIEHADDIAAAGQKINKSLAMPGVPIVVQAAWAAYDAKFNPAPTDNGKNSASGKIRPAAAQPAPSVPSFDFKKSDLVADQFKSVRIQIDELNESARPLRDGMAALETLGQKNSARYREYADSLALVNKRIGDLRKQAANAGGQEAIDNSRRQFDNAVADAEKNSNKFRRDSQIQIADNELKQSLISYQEYYDRKSKIDEAYYSSQALRIKSKITNEEQAAQTARDKGNISQAINSDTNVVRLKAELESLQQEQKNAQVELVISAGEVNKQIAGQVLSIQGQVLQASGQYAQAAVIQAAQQYGDLIRRLQAEGNTAGVDLIRTLINVQVADAQIQEIEQKYGRMLLNLEAEEKRIDIQKNAGILTEYESRQKLLTLYKQQQNIREVELRDLQALRANAGTPEQQKTFDDQIINKQLEIERLQGAVSGANRTFEYGARSAVGEYFDTITNRAQQTRDILTGSFKTVEDQLTSVFKTGKFNASDFFDSLSNYAARFAAQRTLEPFFNAANNIDFSSVGSFFGNLFKSANGHAFAGYTVPFAAGGAFGNGEILTQPTYFKFKQGGNVRDGVAGEAGAEAALPLKRAQGGQLAVYAEGVADALPIKRLANGKLGVVAASEMFSNKNKRAVDVRPFAAGGVFNQTALGAGNSNSKIAPLITTPALITRSDAARAPVNVAVQVQPPKVNVQVYEAQGTKATIKQTPDGNGGLNLQVIIEQIEGQISRNITRGAGIAPALERTYSLNRGAQY